ncbi:MAG: ankyrin repeat domain-containing protein [Wolbachia sp.]
MLHLLAKDGNEEVIKCILEKINPNKLNEVINAVDKENFTSLDCATIYSHLKIVKYFIDKGYLEFGRLSKESTPYTMLSNMIT